FTGAGKTKTIVLYDNLVEAMTADEICAVFAHEMGHGLHKDTVKNSVKSFLMVIIMVVLAWLTVRYPEIHEDFGFAGVNYGFALILLMLVEFAFVSPLLSLWINGSTRKAEYRADAQAVKDGYGEALISGLKKLSRDNFAHLAPDKLLVALEYSHPTLSQRIEAIEKRMKSE
ncbi:MAG: M48 family metalloprotease, partial [Lachnospiraceae bacterium]|nr:M48 family metalloprotease [Lachnospiraceae bacterium]